MSYNSKIIELLEKYEDKIMENTLGSAISEYNQKYTQTYSWEWKDAKEAIAHTLNNLIKYDTNISTVGMAYIIINEWSGVMTFDRGDLNRHELIKVCENILIDLVSHIKTKRREDNNLIGLLNKHSTVDLITVSGKILASIDYDYASGEYCDSHIRLIVDSCTCGSLNQDMLINPRSYNSTLELTIKGE